MNAAHGAKGLLVSTATWVSAEVGASASGTDHSIEAAIITAAGGVLAVVVGPLITDRFRRRRKAIRHVAEASQEQAELADWLRSQLDHAQQVIDAKDAEITELRKQLWRNRRSGGSGHPGAS